MSRHDDARLHDIIEAIDSHLLDREPGVPWKEIARMRDHLAHRYFDTAHAIVQDVVDNDLDPLMLAARTLSGLAQRDPDQS